MPRFNSPRNVALLFCAISHQLVEKDYFKMDTKCMALVAINGSMTWLGVWDNKDDACTHASEWFNAQKRENESKESPDELSVFIVPCFDNWHEC
jgi:hypothetical protein